MKREYRDGVSIVICCFNSAWIIRRTLESLFRQDAVGNLKYEILLIDNNCSDDTVLSAKEVASEQAREIEIIKEPMPGLVNARRTGVKNAKYKYLVFCDDDNLLCESYINTVYGIFEGNPNIGAIGGRGIAEFEAEPDPRIMDKLGCYAIGSQVSHPDWLFGAGMAVRTEIAHAVYTEQRLFLVGRMGDKLLAGDDTELSLSVRARGYELYPTDELTFTHVLKAPRLSYDYCEKMLRGMANSRAPIKVMQSVLQGRSFLSFRLSYLWKRILPTHKNRKIVSAISLWGLTKLSDIYSEFKRVQQNNSRNVRVCLS